MSYKTLPLLFINLGGEMIYILDQRLRAQNIPNEKSRKGECWMQQLPFCLDSSRFVKPMFYIQCVVGQIGIQYMFSMLKIILFLLFTCDMQKKNAKIWLSSIKIQYHWTSKFCVKMIFGLGLNTVYIDWWNGLNKIPMPRKKWSYKCCLCFQAPPLNLFTNDYSTCWPV